jgi:hypothetical protein
MIHILQNFQLVKNQATARPQIGTGHAFTPSSAAKMLNPNPKPVTYF